MFTGYQYQGVMYPSERDVREALYKTTRRALGPTPKTNVAEFWAKYGITLIEKEPYELQKKRLEFKIKQSFLQWRNSKATLTSSLGFVVDSYERAKSDVEGLISLCESKLQNNVTFRDADNNFHDIELEDLRTIKLEIIENLNYAYEQKWVFDDLLKNATESQDLENIDIAFVGKDFRKGEE